ncbi:hypothetical protein [Ralstonia insidiosa]|uniref:hypothetical protein n=1 Tax=Ralstonia insidiosa TaxID=190721 RepID=UPI001FD754E6|nr:hypothetical protein [Ralstonia insidiosa]
MAAVITFLWWVRTVSCVYAVVLVLIALFPVRVVVALGHVAVRVAAFCSPAVARRVERREFARKYQLAQRGQR